MTQQIRTIRIATQGPAGPAGLYPKASWDAGQVPYARASVLAHNGSVWLALRDTSVEPSASVPDDWAIWLDLSGMTGGSVTLGPDGKIDPAQLPALVITDTFVAASQADTLALAAQQGDIAIRSDESATYILSGRDPKVLTNWTELAFPSGGGGGGGGGGVTSVAGLTGVIAAADLKNALSIAATDVSGLAASATSDTTDAGNISSGTLPNARLSAVPNSALANSGITLSGRPVALGGSLSLAAADVAGVQAQSGRLDEIAALSLSKGDIFYYDGAHITNLAAGSSGQFLKTLGSGGAPVWDDTGGLHAASNLTDLADAAAARSNLGLAIGSDVEAYDASILKSAAIGSSVQAYDAQLSSLLRQNAQSADYTLALSDGGKHIFHPDADTAARTFTIPANSSVAFAIGTTLTFVNGHGAGAITIAIASDTLRFADDGTTGSRTLAADGMATALKVTSTEWRIGGSGLS